MTSPRELSRLPVRSPLVGLAATLVVTLVLPGPVGAAGAAAEGPRPLVVLQDPEIDESSGLLARGSLLLTVNDSGSGPVVYAVDARTGRTVGRTTYTSDEVVDVEALADGPGGSVWVGDIGDNATVRPTVAVYRVPPVTRGDRLVEAVRYDLGYPDGPHDAEALLVDPRTGRLHVVTKGVLSGQVFVAPRRLRTGLVNRLRPVADTVGVVTDGAMTADGRTVLRTYGRLVVLDADGWEQRASMPLPPQQQGEGLALPQDPTRVLLSSEGAGSEVLTVPFTRPVLAALGRTTDRGAGTPPPSPQRAGTRTDDDEPARSVVPRRVVIGGAALLLLLGGAAVTAARRRGRSRR